AAGAAAGAASGAAAGAGAATPAATPATPAATAAAAPDTVTYVVRGSSAQVTYGPAGSDLSGSVPMRQTAPLHDVSYYAISAQLQGGGEVSCQILVDGKVISQGTATGGYNIASCEISQDPLTDAWQSDN
ncbi:MAG: hypothetical protein ACRDNZ_04910, partial [Streptosporangiaceae bacterium]